MTDTQKNFVSCYACVSFLGKGKSKAAPVFAPYGGITMSMPGGQGDLAHSQRAVRCARRMNIDCINN